MRLNLSGRGWSSLPWEVIAPHAETVEVLDLSDNALTDLPEALSTLPQLRVVFGSGNPFTRLPTVLGRCMRLEMVGFRGCGMAEVPAEALPPRLRWLTLTDNRLTELPEALGTRPHLQKLMLSGNRLSHLPQSLHGHARLELLRLAANRFETLPPCLPHLPALRWLAVAGNPVTDAAEARAMTAAHRPSPSIEWSDLVLHERLGEGASGVIHRAVWRQAPSEPAVAVKLFKGAMTSDGLPRCEMDACLAAAGHGAWVPVVGRLVGHPEGMAGLVLGLLPPTLQGLAQPPSLQSCTRDMYDDSFHIDPGRAWAVLREVASAVAHLHRQGLMHGDLYAHNILWSPDTGAVRVSDFGAASFLPPSHSALQATDVRALGTLIEELLSRCPPHPAQAQGQALAQRCQATDLHDVPGADTVCAALNAVA